MHLHVLLTPQGLRDLGADLAVGGADAPPASAFAPGDTALIVVEDLVIGRRLLPARFGRRQGKAGRLLASARADTLHRDPALRDAFVRRRCAVPADGIFLSATALTGRRPPLLRRPDGGIFLLLALWDEQVDERTGEHHTCFTLLSAAAGPDPGDGRPAAPAMAALASAAAEAWLKPSAPGSFAADALLALLSAPPHDFLVARQLVAGSAEPPAPAPRIRLRRRPPASTAAPAPRRPPEQLKLF
jgi:putative SOS response-associated peptidase YedK